MDAEERVNIMVPKLPWKKSKNKWKANVASRYEIEDRNYDPARPIKATYPFAIYRNNIFIGQVKKLDNAKLICELIEEG